MSCSKHAGFRIEVCTECYEQLREVSRLIHEQNRELIETGGLLVAELEEDRAKLRLELADARALAEGALDAQEDAEENLFEERKELRASELRTKAARIELVALGHEFDWSEYDYGSLIEP